MRHPSLFIPVTLVLLLAFPAACGDDGTKPCVTASIEVSPSEATLEMGETVQLSAAALDSDGSVCGSVNWSSSSAAVATCSGTGLVTGVSPGNAIISASAGGVSGTASVSVLAPCAFTCDCDMSSCSWDISCESGGTSTEFINESTTYQYDNQGRRTKITKTLSRVVTYLNTGNAYNMTGPIVWEPLAGKVTWDIQVTGGAFGETPQTCSGSKSF